MANNFKKIVLIALIPVACTNGDFSFKNKPVKKTGIPYKTDKKIFALIQQGDVLLRQGTGPFSVGIVRFMNEKKPFSHCAIVCKVNDTLQVIHSISPEFSSADGVQTQSLNHFFADVADSNVAIVRPIMDSIQKSVFIAEAKRLLIKQVKFDHHFDFEDSTKLYCSEFVHHCYVKSMKNDPFTLMPKSKIPLMLFQSFFDQKLFTTVWYARELKK